MLVISIGTEGGRIVSVTVSAPDDPGAAMTTAQHFAKVVAPDRMTARAAVESQLRDGMTAAELAASVGRSRSGVSRSLAELKREGLVRSVAGPRNAKTWFHA